jgi:hypothetical protein
MEQEKKKEEEEKEVIPPRKLGYFSGEYTRKAVFEETIDLPAVSFSYKPLNIYQTAQLTTSVLATDSIENSTESNLRMVTEHLIDWDLVKENPNYSPDSEEGAEFSAEFVKVDFTNMNELKLVSPIIMNHVLSMIRGDECNPFLEKADLDAQVKNS